MAKANPQLIEAIRNTVKKLERSNQYQWGHMGSCNCGFLAQEVSALSKTEIHQRAMQKYGDWNDQLNDYCPTSGLFMDDLITQMLVIGFDTQDLKHLEQLSDPKILHCLPSKQRHLKHNVKKDVILYLKAWALLLEEELAAKINLPKKESILI